MEPRILQVAPSILAGDPGRLADEARRAEEAGADLIHIDVMDGRFVPNITFGPAVVGAIRHATSLPLDVHLMIVEPDHYIARFRDAGADLLTVHWEALVHAERSVTAIRDAGDGADRSLRRSRRALGHECESRIRRTEILAARDT